jgi:nicotinamidase-related amidase
MFIFIFFMMTFMTPIASAESSHAALVVIDMQQQFVDVGIPPDGIRSGYARHLVSSRKLAALTSELIGLIKAAMSKNLPIVFLEYSKWGDTIPALKEATRGYDKVVFLKKDTDDMFHERNTYRKMLEDYLRGHSVDTLIVTGANGEACVRDSLKGAQKAGYSLIAYTAGIASFATDPAKAIYPYPHYYSVVEYGHFGNNCKACTFRYADSLSDLAETFAANNSQSISKSPSDLEPEVQR